MTKKSRITLKEYFKAGEMPTQEDFKDLIDSSLNRVDDDIEVITKNGQKCFGIGTSVPEANFHVNGDLKLKEGVAVKRITEGGHLSANNRDTLVTESAIAQFTGTITPPVGTILPWFPGCFGQSDNNDFEDLTEQIVLADNWRVCNGEEVDDPESPFHGKRLPVLTQDCFLMGGTSHGATGGNNDATHSHQIRKHSHNFNLKADDVADHRHGFQDWYSTASNYSISDSGDTAPATAHYRGRSRDTVTSYGGGHHHTVSGSVGSGNNLDTEEVRTHDEPADNRPKFLTTKFIIRIK